MTEQEASVKASDDPVPPHDAAEKTSCTEHTESNDHEAPKSNDLSPKPDEATPSQEQQQQQSHAAPVHTEKGVKKKIAFFEYLGKWFKSKNNGQNADGAKKPRSRNKKQTKRDRDSVIPEEKAGEASTIEEKAETVQQAETVQHISEIVENQSSTGQHLQSSTTNQVTSTPSDPSPHSPSTAEDNHVKCTTEPNHTTTSTNGELCHDESKPTTTTEPHQQPQASVEDLPELKTSDPEASHHSEAKETDYVSKSGSMTTVHKSTTPSAAAECDNNNEQPSSSPPQVSSTNHEIVPPTEEIETNASCSKPPPTENTEKADEHEPVHQPSHQEDQQQRVADAAQ